MKIRAINKEDKEAIEKILNEVREDDNYGKTAITQDIAEKFSQSKFIGGGLSLELSKDELKQLMIIMDTYNVNMTNNITTFWNSRLEELCNQLEHISKNSRVID